MAKAELARLAALVPDLVIINKQLDKGLSGSGICGSSVLISPGLIATKWLLSNCPNDVTLDLDTGTDQGDLDEFLRDLTGLPLSDAVLYRELSTQDLLRTLCGLTKPGAHWLKSIVSLSKDDSVLAEHAYGKLGFWLNWRLENEFSRTCLRLTKRSPYFHDDGLLKHVDIPECIKKRLPEPVRIGRADKKKILDSARAVLYQQGRETDSINYCTASDLYLFELDRGVDVVLLGTEPSRRRYFESFYGFIAAKNSIACAYGGAWIFGSKADIGINIFDTFRGGESAHLFAQIMRCYHNFLGVDQFEVEPYQFGENNEEGMQSGAFWFYWKLGFRSVLQDLNNLALREIKKMSSKTHRTSASTLKRLCGERLRFSLKDGLARSISTQELGVQVCNTIGKSFGGNIELATRSTANDLAEKLNLNLSGWSEVEKEALVQLSLPLSILIKHAKLTTGDKKDLELLIKAKVAPSERDYCLSLKRCSNLFAFRPV
ncbi:MAG: hypothetical protein IT342_21500 [Candidatus Melainabacteria bacterium]|nr:hypothetical protein [Candidatus Melainabacteria bacterium]